MTVFPWGKAIGTAGKVAGKVAPAVSAAASRGLSRFGGIFSSEANAAGGEVWTSVGTIEQDDFESIVNSGLMQGDVNILTGVHGFPDGTMLAEPGFYAQDLQKFGGLSGVNIYNVPQMTAGEIGAILNGPGTTIGGFCNSGACLAPFK